MIPEELIDRLHETRKLISSRSIYPPLTERDIEFIDCVIRAFLLGDVEARASVIAPFNGPYSVVFPLPEKNEIAIRLIHPITSADFEVILQLMRLFADTVVMNKKEGAK